MITYLKEGLRILKRRYRKDKIKQYKGDAKEICRQIVKKCWNGGYFQTSAGHFSEFWIRDFGWCCESLLKLGYKKEVLMTLEYVLDRYKKQGRITTTINPYGKLLDIHRLGADSLAYLTKCLILSKFKIDEYKEFLEKEAQRYFDVLIDKNGLVKKGYFSSMKDQAKRNSSCYDNCMIAMLSNNLNKLKLNNPFKKFDYKKLIKENFWNGKYFYDDLDKRKIVTGDSNVFPFYCRVFNDKKMMKSCFKCIQAERLDKPFPLKYSNVILHMIFVHYIFTRNYEVDSVWMHMGPLYVKLIKKIDKKKFKEYYQQYTELIERHKNFLEVFDSKGEIYKTLLYYSDESMIWAANYLNL